MEVLIMAGQLFLSLSILVILHEMGHFFPAKWFGTRVEKFYLFFDPWFSLFKFKKGDTEYGVGWLPLGGYVKISGMIDESMDTEQMEGPPQPWEFRSKTSLQRIIIMLGGVTVNFILGMLIMSVIVYTMGTNYLPSKNVTEGIHVEKLGLELGLQDGDKILSIGDQEFDKFNDALLARAVILDDVKTFKIERNGVEKTISIPESFINKLTVKDDSPKDIFTARMPFVIDTILTDGNAAKSDLKKNDRIIAINDISTPYYHDFTEKIKPFTGKAITLNVLRGRDTVQIATNVSENGKVGIGPKMFDFSQEYFGLGASIVKGSSDAWGVIFTQIKAFSQIGKGRLKASESVGGFMGIAKMYGGQWDWLRFWKLTAMLSMVLGFVNLLPIPALDGGHVMFLLYEVVVGRKPSDKFLEYATMFGFILLMGLMLAVNGNEIWQWFSKSMGWS